MSDTSDLMNVIVDYIKGYKDYNVPSVCKKYNIECDSNLDPMNSRRVYIESGLIKISFSKLRELAKTIILEECDPVFVKKVDPYLNDNFFSISMITRRKIINWLSNQSLIEGKLRIDEMLSLSWNLECIPSSYGHKNANEDILQHMVRNDDLSYKEMFEVVLSAMYVSDKKFIDLIQTIVHPRIREGFEQKTYVDKLNNFLIKDGYKLINTKSISGEPIFTVEKISQGIDGKIKNLIFAAYGTKPDIVIEDSLTNDVKIIGEENKCLVYTLPISNEGLSWHDLVTWWNKGNEEYELCVEQELFKRMELSLDSEPEKMFMKTYYNNLHKLKNNKLPALIPQIYCHYDPKSAKMRNGQIYVHQRMDFLLLISNNRRVVIEIDGKQHYSVGDKSSPELYSKMVEDDRKLKFYGYDVFRFGGFEFVNTSEIQRKIVQFIQDLYKYYDLI
ncbi:AbiJ-related protein [Clostridium brassicae]|uniref:AbiJ-NTD3 domain-containing protein n=1 Tax=Clostridium brassicae TaxID=2999072 RepID=A0ABT4D7Z1_9CLOT|nr:hypothetical protein [Clostridium brassicae]MCY6958420.1 hypothetical protein [Clostridium brassicae]